MNRVITCLVTALALSPFVAIAGNICVQNDSNGDVVVMKGVGKGPKAVTAYLAHFQGGSSYDFFAMSGSAILGVDGSLVAGLTEYGASAHAFIERTRFHRLRCSDSTSDGKIDVNDSCSDIMFDVPQDVQSSFSGHVIPCLPQLKP
jgi:hypothetical protein